MIPTKLMFSRRELYPKIPAIAVHRTSTRPMAILLAADPTRRPGRTSRPCRPCRSYYRIINGNTRSETHFLRDSVVNIHLLPATCAALNAVNLVFIAKRFMTQKLFVSNTRTYINEIYTEPLEILQKIKLLNLKKNVVIITYCPVQY